MIIKLLLIALILSVGFVALKSTSPQNQQQAVVRLPNSSTSAPFDFGLGTLIAGGISIGAKLVVANRKNKKIYFYKQKLIGRL